MYITQWSSFVDYMILVCVGVYFSFYLPCVGRWNMMTKSVISNCVCVCLMRMYTQANKRRKKAGRRKDMRACTQKA